MSQSVGDLWASGQWVEVTEGPLAGHLGWIIKEGEWAGGAVVLRVVGKLNLFAISKTDCFPVQGLDYETLTELADLALALGDRDWFMSITDRLANHPRVTLAKKSR